jgi:hypothetical protein
LRFLDSSPVKQVITGRRRRIGNDFRIGGAPEPARAEMYIHDMFF